MIITQSTQVTTAYYPSKMLSCQFMQYTPRVQPCTYILALNGGRFKIGMTKNLHQRIRDYTTIQPDLKLVAAIFTNTIEQSEELETQILGHWGKYRIGASEVVEVNILAMVEYLQAITAPRLYAVKVDNHSQLMEHK